MRNLGGTVRACSAGDTLARIRPLLPTFGITRLAAQEGLGGIAIPVTICFRPNARGQSTSQGKGITRELADVSAVMEAIEQFHAERLPPPDVIASVAELRRAGRDFVDPAVLNKQPHESLYSARDPIGWLVLQRLGGPPILVPRFYLDLDRAAPVAEISSVAFNVTSNGLASGNTLEEAIVHGLYELIERHCFTEYMALDLAERRARSLALDTVDGSSHLGELLQRLDEAGLDLSVRAIHGPLGIPAFRARIRPRDPENRTPGTPGFGAHFAPEVALSRAITETVQGRVTQIAGSRDDFYPYTYHDINQALLPRPPRVDAGSLAWSEIPRPPEFSSFEDVLAWTVAALERHGFADTCFYDQRRPELGNLPIVSVVSPNLRFDRNLFTRAELE
jgi:ribosomal protein S12 methylthiotransferase accessory factor